MNCELSTITGARQKRSNRITLPNEASVGLHESFAYGPVGSYERVGFRRGRWWGVSWWMAVLQERLHGPTPADPGPPARLQR